jgi:hypothetical protein
MVVVQLRVPNSPARAASRVPEQIVTKRCGDSRSRSASCSRSRNHWAVTVISGVTFDT